MGKNAYSNSSFPDFMQHGAPVGGLRNLNQNLGQYFDFNPIQQSADSLQQMQMSAAKGAANSAARAMVGRSIQAGGTGAGADFARASALQPFFRQQGQQNLDLNQLRAQMQQNQGQLSAQLIGNIASLRQNNQTNRQNYAVDAARLAQKNIGVSGSVGFGSGQSNNQVVDASGGAGGMGFGPGQFTPGYIPNSGPITPATFGGAETPFKVVTGTGAANTTVGTPNGLRLPQRRAY